MALGRNVGPIEEAVVDRGRTSFRLLQLSLEVSELIAGIGIAHRAAPV